MEAGMIPPDFDHDLWLSPLEFQGLLGWAAANGIYYELFREDEFAKPIAQLHAIPKVSRYLERFGHPAPPSPIRSAPLADCNCRRRSLGLG